MSNEYVLIEGLIKRRPSSSSQHDRASGKPKISVNGGRRDGSDAVSVKLPSARWSYHFTRPREDVFFQSFA